MPPAPFPSAKALSQVTLRLESMMYGGSALGHYEGQVVLVNGGLPGETVRVRVDEQRRRFMRATVREVIAPSPDRVVPRCPHFGLTEAACGGCHWQHIAYAAQLRYKAAIVREQLQRLGGVRDPSVPATLPSPAIWAYRNHAQFHRAPAGRPGFQAARSRNVVPLQECHIIEPPLQAWLQANQALAKGEERISVRCSNQPDRPALPDRSAPATTFVIEGVTFQVSNESFFQVNTSIVATLVDHVLGRLQLNGAETVLDAYCGVGLFTRFIAPRVRHVIGIETKRSALADARLNLAGCDRVTWHLGAVEEILPKLTEPSAAAVIDPPRAGCAPEVIAALIVRPIARVVYVSCDPATLARDAKRLIAGGYRFSEAQPIDLFPHTYHIETVAHFQWMGQGHV